jgi:hypothetical protein
MFKKKPILEYESINDYYPNPITPSTNHVPTWYKKMPLWENNEVINKENQKFNFSVKHCAPFLDAMINGYMITLPHDLYVESDESKCYLTWNISDYPPLVRNNNANPLIVPSGHHPIECTWSYPLSHTIPKGYSVLFTHPLNRYDLPFTTLSGIVDGGDFIMRAKGKIPFYIKKDFKGTIPKGTPIIQLTLFRNENWKSNKKKGLIDIGEMQNKESNSLIYGWYKNFHWQRKKYE